MLRQFESFQRKILCEIFPAYSFDSIANLIGVYSDMTFACKVHQIMITKCSCVCYVLCHMQKHFLLHLEIRNSNIGWNYTWNFRNKKFNVTLKEHQLSDISTELNCTDIIGLYWYGHIIYMYWSCDYRVGRSCFRRKRQHKMWVIFQILTPFFSILSGLNRDFSQQALSTTRHHRL